MIDTDAAYSSSGNVQQYYAYCILMGFTPFIDASKSNMIRYGIGKEKSKGTAQIVFSLGNFWMSFDIHVVSTNIPIILAINDIDLPGVYFNNLTNKLTHCKSGISASTVRLRGHAYLKWDLKLLTDFTVAKLHRLHRRFGRPSTHKLANFLHRSGPDDTPGHTRTTLGAIAQLFDPFQRYAQASRRFKFKLKDNFEFNQTICADVFYIDRRPILYVFDEATYYQAATWLRSMNAEELLQALRRCWIDIYIGSPDIITDDAGKRFIARSF